MVPGLALAASLAFQAPAAPAAEPKPSPCAEAVARGVNAAAAAVCQGDDLVALAAKAASGSSERLTHLVAAAGHYRRAATMSPDSEVKVQALEALAGVYDAPQLNDPLQREFVLLELATLRPGDMTYLYRVAASQEAREHVDAAENTLLMARQRQPDDPEPYRMLAQFYARRASAMHFDATAADRQAAQSAPPAAPDADGVYRVGAGLPSPQRKGVPRMPPEASAAGIKGIVVLEITIDETGKVADSRVVRSIPLLDAEAEKTVREWQFEPTIVDGKPVPVRTVVTVNFTQ
jgi:TonB family protein